MNWQTKLVEEIDKFVKVMDWELAQLVLEVEIDCEKGKVVKIAVRGKRR